MSTVLEPEVTEPTLGDFVARFGNLPVWRFRAGMALDHATEADVARLAENDRRFCELIDGTLVEKTVGWSESWIAFRLGTFLNNFVMTHNLGMVLGADGMLRLEPGQVRIPDVSFIAKERYAGKTVTIGAFWDFGCDLAVEVISPSNTEREMALKLEDYFNAGVTRVWYVYPQTQEVFDYTSPTAVTKLTVADMLAGGTVLPGFTLPLASLFAPLAG